MQSSPSRHLSFNNVIPAIRSGIFLCNFTRGTASQRQVALQDRFDADVNMLFFVLWAAENYRALNVADIRELIALPRRLSRRSSSPKQFPWALTPRHRPTAALPANSGRASVPTSARASSPPHRGTPFGSTLYRTGAKKAPCLKFWPEILQPVGVNRAIRS